MLAFRPNPPLGSVLVGASRFAHAGWLRHDKALHAMLGIARFPGEDAIRGFFHQFTQARIEEIKNDLNADGFCTKAFFATEAAFLAVLFAYNLLALYQAQVAKACGYRKPSTLRSAVFVGGAILGRCGRQTLLRFSNAGGGLHKHNPLSDAALRSQKPIAPLLPRSPDLTMFWPVFDHAGCSI